MNKDKMIEAIAENRRLKISGLVEAGLITPAIKTVIEEQYMKPKMLASSLPDGRDDNFDFLMKILTENKPVKLGEQTGVQLLELPNIRAQGGNVSR